MKTKNVSLISFFVALIGFGLLVTSCGQDDEGIRIGGDLIVLGGIDSTELEEYSGDIGLRVNLRPIMRKGYEIAQVKFNVNSHNGKFDQLVDLDPLIGMAELIIPVENLSSEEEAELRDGVPVDIEVLDENQSIIYSESISIISFQENKDLTELFSDNLPYLKEEITFRAGMPHYIQVLTPLGGISPCPAGSYAVGIPESAGSNNSLLFESCSDYNEYKTFHQYYFYKYPGSDNTFAIYSAASNRYLAYDKNDNTFRQSGAFSFNTHSPESLDYNYKFIIERGDHGYFVIKRFDNGVSLKREFNGYAYYWRGIPNGTEERFRILAYDSKYQIEELETVQLKPILPRASTSFGFNNTLANCGAGELSQEVGTAKKFTTSQTSWVSETIGVKARVGVHASVTIGAKAEAKFFGSGGEVSGSVTAGIEVSLEASRETSLGEETTLEVSEEYFTVRVVTVPSGSASLVYDAIQSYNTVRLPFAKRIRLRAREVNPFANNADVGPLFGTDIATQLHMANFRGLITFIGEDYVEITVRGTSRLNNFVVTDSKVIAVDPDC